MNRRNLSLRKSVLSWCVIRPCVVCGFAPVKYAARTFADWSLTESSSATGCHRDCSFVPVRRRGPYPGKCVTLCHHEEVSRTYLGSRRYCNCWPLPFSAPKLNFADTRFRIPRKLRWTCVSRPTVCISATHWHGLMELTGISQIPQLQLKPWRRAWRLWWTSVMSSQTNSHRRGMRSMPPRLIRWPRDAWFFLGGIRHLWRCILMQKVWLVFFIGTILLSMALYRSKPGLE